LRGDGAVKHRIATQGAKPDDDLNRFATAQGSKMQIGEGNG